MYFWPKQAIEIDYPKIVWKSSENRLKINLKIVHISYCRFSRQLLSRFLIDFRSVFSRYLVNLQTIIRSEKFKRSENTLSRTRRCVLYSLEKLSQFYPWTNRRGRTAVHLARVQKRRAEGSAAAAAKIASLQKWEHFSTFLTIKKLISPNKR